MQRRGSPGQNTGFVASCLQPAGPCRGGPAPQRGEGLTPGPAGWEGGGVHAPVCVRLRALHPRPARVAAGCADRPPAGWGLSADPGRPPRVDQRLAALRTNSKSCRRASNRGNPRRGCFCACKIRKGRGFLFKGFWPAEGHRVAGSQAWGPRCAACSTEWPATPLSFPRTGPEPHPCRPGVTARGRCLWTGWGQRWP